MSGSEQDRTDVVIDFDVLRDIRDLMEDDYPDLVRRFLVDAAELLAQMERASAQDDAVLMHRAAHTLKSSAAALGALGLSDRAKHLETLGRAGVLAGADVEVAAARAQLRLAEKTLEQTISEGLE